MPQETGWYYAQNDETVGPVTFSELVAVLPKIGGKNALVFGPGLAEWTEARHIGDLAEMFGSPGNRPPRPPRARRADEIDYEICGSEMQYVVVELDPEETVIAEAGAMMFQTAGIEMKTVFGDPSAQEGGFFGKVLSAGKRMLTGESLFMTTFTHRGRSGKEQVGFASPYPGKIIAMHLDQLGGELICQKDAFLCAAKGVSVGIAFQKKFGVGLFGGEGFIMQRLTGDGIAMVHAGGTLMKRSLAAGETLKLDTGCLVALVPSVQYDIQFVGGFKNTLFGGEGLFLATVTGPGDVWLQSLPFSRLAGRVLSAGSRTGQSKDEGSVLGGLGNILMGGGD
ncbi:MAG: AIM24 family protein [Planctomycetes bacterium]|nr:AIM24 family protein [Planctomycetota bacterium]